MWLLDVMCVCMFVVNRIGDEGARAVGAVMRHCPQLQMINLGSKREVERGEGGEEKIGEKERDGMGRRWR